MKLTDHTDADLIAKLGPKRILRLAASVRSKQKAPHAGGRPLKPTACPRCGREMSSAAAAKEHCAVGPGRPVRPTRCPKCGKKQPSAAAAKAHCANK